MPRSVTNLDVVGRNLVGVDQAGLDLEVMKLSLLRLDSGEAGPMPSSL